MKKFTKIGLVLSIIYVIIVGNTVNIKSVNAQDINIPDVNFRECINAELGQGPADNITDAQMSTISILDCASKNIRSIVGAEYLINANILYLDDNQLTDLSPLNGLLNLNFATLNSQNVQLDPKVINSSNYSLPTIFDNRGSDLYYDSTNNYNIQAGTTLTINNSWRAWIVISSSVVTFDGVIEQEVTNMPLPVLNATSFTNLKGTTLTDDEIINLASATATDGKQTDITNNIVVSDRNSLNIDKVGVYPISLSVKDLYDQEVIKEIYVSILEENSVISNGKVLSLEKEELVYSIEEATKVSEKSIIEEVSAVAWVIETGEYLDITIIEQDLLSKIQSGEIGKYFLTLKANPEKVIVVEVVDNNLPPAGNLDMLLILVITLILLISASIVLRKKVFKLY